MVLEILYWWNLGYLVLTHQLLGSVKSVLGFLIEVHWIGYSYFYTCFVQEQCQTVYDTAYDTQCHTGNNDMIEYFLPDFWDLYPRYLMFQYYRV